MSAAVAVGAEVASAADCCTMSDPKLRNASTAVAPLPCLMPPAPVSTVDRGATDPPTATWPPVCSPSPTLRRDFGDTVRSPPTASISVPALGATCDPTGTLPTVKVPSRVPPNAASPITTRSPSDSASPVAAV